MIGVKQGDNIYDYEGHFIVHDKLIIHPHRVTVNSARNRLNFFCSEPGKYGRLFLDYSLEEFEEKLIPNTRIDEYVEYLI